MTAILASGGPSPLWYLSRGSGAVTLVLLTVSVVLGIADVRGWRTERWPRFVLDGLHRNVSLLVLALLAFHIATTVADSFTPISLIDAVVPFASVYRPIWLGLGALAFDLLLAVALTSVLRRRLGLEAWRRVHWLAYACWPLALVHGLGTGTDAKATWMLVLSVACLASVWVAAWLRVTSSYPEAGNRAVAGFSALILGPLALAIWVPNGPLASAWARRAGTPPALLGQTARSSRSDAARLARSGVLRVPFTGSVAGALRQAQAANGLATVQLDLTFSDQRPAVTRVIIEGQPLSGGGVSMTQSQVTMGPKSRPAAYRGSVLSLSGQNLLATVTDAAGHALRLDLALVIGSANQAVSGQIGIQHAGRNR